MKKSTIQFSILLATTIGLLFTACSNDEWDKHYNNTDVVITKQSLSEIIKNESDLSIFSRLLEISGYDIILSSSQTFTVWAPLDTDPTWSADFGAYLDESVPVDTLMIKKVVGNHISRYSYPTSGLDSLRLYMLCSKISDFRMVGSQAYMGKSALAQDMNIPAKNGLLHKISGYNPYTPSHWEFLFNYPETAGLDSLKAYFETMIVEDMYGNDVNQLFEDYAKLDDDDSTYIVLAPKNNAWSAALQTALNYHKVYNDVSGKAIKYSKESIISSLFFSKVSDPTGLDSITSTSGIVFKNVSNLFEDADRYNLSNGTMFIADSLRMKPIESYHRPIVVEAETNIYGRSNTNSILYNRSYTGADFNLSNKRYAFMKYTGNSTGRVVFNMNIPNVLSGKYKLYVVIAPHALENPITPMPAKFIVKMVYRSVNGSVPSITSRPSFDSSSNRNNPSTPTGGYIASADTVSKVYIYDFTFPYASMFEKGNPQGLDVAIQIENMATSSDERNGRFTRDLLIDCIILEPVE